MSQRYASNALTFREAESSSQRQSESSFQKESSVPFPNTCDPTLNDFIYESRLLQEKVAENENLYNIRRTGSWDYNNWEYNLHHAFMSSNMTDESFNSSNMVEVKNWVREMKEFICQQFRELHINNENGNMGLIYMPCYNFEIKKAVVIPMLKIYTYVGNNQNTSPAVYITKDRKTFRSLGDFFENGFSDFSHCYVCLPRNGEYTAPQGGSSLPLEFLNLNTHKSFCYTRSNYWGVGFGIGFSVFSSVTAPMLFGPVGLCVAFVGAMGYAARYLWSLIPEGAISSIKEGLEKFFIEIFGQANHALVVKVIGEVRSRRETGSSLVNAVCEALQTCGILLDYNDLIRVCLRFMFPLTFLTSNVPFFEAIIGGFSLFFAGISFAMGINVLWSTIKAVWFYLRDNNQEEMTLPFCDIESTDFDSFKANLAAKGVIHEITVDNSPFTVHPSACPKVINDLITERKERCRINVRDESFEILYDSGNKIIVTGSQNSTLNMSVSGVHVQQKRFLTQ